MKQPSDTKRRQRAAFRRGWLDAMEIVMDRIDALARSGDLPAAAVQELRTACNHPPPSLETAAPVQRRVS